MLNRVYGLIMCAAVVGGLVSQVYVPFPDSNIYFLESGIFTAWLVADALERRSKLWQIFVWAFFSLLLCPIVVPRWYANRPLKALELRRGGTDSNFFNAFGLVTTSFTGVSATINFMAFGANRGFELIINSGFAVAGIAFVLALSTRRDSITEMGKPLSAEPVAERVKSKVGD